MPPRRGPRTRTVRALAYSGRGRHPRARRPGAAQRRRRSSAGWAPAAWRSWSPCPTGCRPTRPRGRGHVVKARYTPLQSMVLGVDEQDSPHHELLARGRRPRPGCRSSSPTCTPPCRRCWPGCASGRRHARVAYVMTDGGALPLGFSRTVSALARGRLARLAPSRSGRRYGGDLEAVNVHTGLLAARHVRARATSPSWPRGPGNLGTGTRWGFSGTAAGEAVNAAATLGGRRGGLAAGLARPTPRARHRGVSHHSLTAYGRVALAPADVPVPLLPGAFGERVRAQAAQLVADSGGRLRRCDVAGGRPRRGPGAQPGAALDDGPRPGRRTRRRSSRRRPPGGTPPPWSEAAARPAEQTGTSGAPAGGTPRSGPPPTPGRGGNGPLGACGVVLSARRRGRRRRSASRRA